MPKSPADTAGLKSKDVITHINGQSAPNTVELRNLMRRHKAGETIRLTVRRGKQTLEVAVKMITLSSPDSIGSGR